jgi:D-inositol-3-phosphate glycosyltransferase
MSGVAGLQLKHKWNIPLVHMFHTLGIMKNRVAQSPGEIEGDYRIAGERKVIVEADHMIASTPAELAQLQFLYQADSRRISIIPPGVDTSRFYPIPMDEAKEYIGVPPCGRMLLFVGRIEPLKGLDILLQAIAYMRKQPEMNEVQFCLTVIGGDPEAGDSNQEMRRIQALREQFGLQDLVTFIGKKSQETLPYYYSAAEAVVVPSFYESFGMVALEAMACGTPVVASQVGGLAYLVKDGETGFTIPVDDPIALAESLTRILKEDDLRSRLAKRASEEAQLYSWDLIASQLVQVYQRFTNDLITDAAQSNLLPDEYGLLR